MSNALTAADRAAVETLIRKLEDAWNAMDGSAYAAPFAPDADFVNIRGDHFKGRDAIAAGHHTIFRTIYAGSKLQCTIETARLIHSDIALAHVHAVMEAPQGPLAGRNLARFSVVLTRKGDDWEIASFHNTLEAQQGPPR
jgi:uncharacterized protein (TIGR02246 family)